ncbi:phosphotransferase [Microbacterium sp.]|uniref:phosphotransferase n=1 Tax=Microbacterium sp. TaxID=51671 RepID=UPI0039E272CF
MGRSAFTLAAAVTAALPGAEVTGARALTADGDGRFDAAVATLRDGRELAIRVADDDEAARELASEALALRALTAGARAMLPFAAPEYVGETQVHDAPALVTTLLPGFQIDAALVPAGRGAAESMGAAIAAVHALPTSVVRGAGLPARSAQETREEIERLIDTAAATGRVPARLTVRWRDAVADDDLWRFESTVTLGGAQSASFVFADDDERGPRVTGVLGWHGLSVGDPAVDLAWLSTAPEAADDVLAAYARAADRTPDGAIEVRARLSAELEFARWLVHGDALHDPAIVDDAAGLLEALAEGLRSDDLRVIAARSEGVDSAMDALDRVPTGAKAAVDTSMQTDAYTPSELWREEGATAEVAGAGVSGAGVSGAADDSARLGSVGDDHGGASGREIDPAVAAHRAEAAILPTEDLSDVRPADGSSGPIAPLPEQPDDDAISPEDEAQRAARAALQRWRSSDSE